MITIRKDSLVAVLPENHPLSNASAISINDLRRERFISPGKQSAHRFLTMDLCKKHGFEPCIVLETTQLNSVMDYIRQGVGIYLMMKQVAKDHMIPGDRIVPLAEHVSIAIVIARLKSSQQPEKIQLLWNFIDDYFTLNRSHA